MLCSRCKKRPAVVFIKRMENDKTFDEGFCLLCAKQLGIKPVDDMLGGLMEKMGITEEDLEEMAEQAGLMAVSPDGEEDGDFSMGGAPSNPLLSGLMGVNGDAQSESASPNAQDKEKKKKKGKPSFVEQYCTNLTANAREGKIDAIIGRDREIYRVMQILSRRTKNNPCLIGEPGVGKTAIAEGLALRIAAGDVPPRLANKEIYLLDLTSLVAGTQFRGQFESRIKSLIEEVKAAGNIILFIDEVHTLVGAGDAEGSMSAANILKPALSRGEIQVIGATTFTEYRKYIEKDAALERRFQPVTVDEPSAEDTVRMLLGIKQYYELFHGVVVPDALVARTVALSERYITDRFLPDKAIDLLDEACAATALKNRKAAEYEALTARVTALREEEQALMNAETVDYEKLANTRADLLKAEQQAEAIREQATRAPVDEEALAAVIELWTGIPAAKVRENELSRLSSLEERFRAKIVGQEEALSAVADAVRRSRVQISPRRRPASFIFVGPTGVGKTELVKVLAAELFDTPDNLIRLDMSEFMEKHTVARLIGSPPGYVGYDEAGQLTEKVRRHPYSVILFDEIEKAHPDVLNLLLQILDEGRVTDAHGRRVNFENTVIVMTSNAGSTAKEMMGFGKDERTSSRERAEKALSDFLRPEFLGRVDEIVYFAPLTRTDFEEIARMMLCELSDSCAERGITLRFGEEVPGLLADEAYGGKRGARDLRNVLRRKVESKLASLLIENNGLTGVAIAVQDGVLSFTTV